MSTLSEADRGHLMRALALAAFSTVSASPNPSVGCVVVRDDVRIADGVTAPVGGPHAEVVALRAAGASARGATAYVTLEPCAHEGRTPPCTTALLESGIRRVVIAHPEIHRPALGGAGTLRAHGVEVLGPLPPTDMLRAAVAAQLEAFRTFTQHQRPHVTLKLAQTADGALRRRDGERWITGPAARRSVHRWRCGVDAVLVGAGTILADDPRLDVREVPCPRSPRPVVLDARLRTPATAQVVRRGAVIVTSRSAATAARAAREALEAAGAAVVAVPAGRAGGVELEPALRAIAETGIASVLAEPGPILARALIDAGLVDRLVLHIALGLGDGPTARAVPAPHDHWRMERIGGAGDDLIMQLVSRERGDEVPLGGPSTPDHEEVA